MGGWLKADTAATVKIGPFVDDTDFKTAETGLTIQKADVRLSKNGGNLAAASADQGASDAGAAHDELGYYDISLGTGDTDTEGTLRVIIKESGALVVWDDFIVLAAAVYDSLVAGTDALQVDAVEISSDAVAAANLEAACDGNTYNVGGGAIVAASVTGAVGSVTGAVGSVTGAVGSVTGAVTVGTMNTTALADFFDTDSGKVFADAVAGSVVKETATSATVTGDVTVGATSIASIVDAVWNETSSGHTGAGAAGAQLWSDIDAILDDTGTAGVVVASIANNAITAAAIAQNAIDADAVAADVMTEIASYLPTAATIADAVWDELSTDHTSAGKAGAQLWTDVDAILADTGTDGVIVASLAAGSITATVIATDAIDADAIASDAVIEIATAATGLSAYGTGSESVTLGVSVGGTPIDGAAVWITSDVAGATVVAGTVYTTATGHVSVFLDPGTYYVWKQHAGYNFSNPETITVTDV